MKKVFLFLYVQFILPSYAQHFAPPAISVLHDVCITQLGGCNRAFTYDRVFRKKSDLYNVKVKKVYPGVTAMLTANHGWLDKKFGQGDEVSSKKVMYDWSNYEHWSESCFLFHSLVENYGDQINRSIHKYDKRSDVVNIGLPQIRPSIEKDCGGNVHGIYGKMTFPKGKKKRSTHDARLSEGFLAFARAASRSLQRVLHEEGRVDNHSLGFVYCDDMKPHRKLHSGVLEVVCFDTVVEMDPFTPHLVEGNVPIPQTPIPQTPTQDSTMSRQFQRDVLSLISPKNASKVKQMKSLKERTEENMSMKEERKVTLLTRKYGPTWDNRGFVVESIQTAIKIANKLYASSSFVYKLHDAGHAEDYGLNNRCYSIMPQIDLWASSWLVIAPHGAHETNVLFMEPSSGGLIEAFACGHRQNWFEVFAALSGVPYQAAHETDNGDRVDCSGDGLGRKYLDMPRNVSFDHDSLLESVYKSLGVPTKLAVFPKWAEL